MTTPHKTTPKTDTQGKRNEIELEIAARMNLPSTETGSDTENEPKAQELHEEDGRDLRRRKKT